MGCGERLETRTSAIATPQPAPRTPRPGARTRPEARAKAVLSHPGPGTELVKLLAEVDLGYTETCRCLEYARRMNLRGMVWAERNVFLISTWLKEEARLRDLPFDQELAEMVIRQAIANARSVAANNPPTTGDSPHAQLSAPERPQT